MTRITRVSKGLEKLTGGLQTSLPTLRNCPFHRPHHRYGLIYAEVQILRGNDCELKIPGRDENLNGPADQGQEPTAVPAAAMVILDKEVR